MKKISSTLCLATAFLFFVGVSETFAVLKQAPPISQVKPLSPQKMPRAPKQPRPITAVELPCVSTLKQGTPPYSTTGFILEARNSFSAPIPTGTKLHVSYTIRYDSSIGLSPEEKNHTHTLASDLMPGQTVEVYSIYQGPYVMLTNCKTWFDGGLPDLQVMDARIVSGQIKLLIRNNSLFISAGDSVAKVRMMKCSQIELGFVDVTVPQVLPQTTVTVLKSIRLPAGFQYLDAIADINKAVPESNEDNNAFTGVGVCIH